jgi:hypothetical protein
MYVCRPTTCHVHLYNLSKKKNKKVDISRSIDNRAKGATGMAPTGDQNPLKTQKLTKTQKVIKPIKHPKNIP